MARTPDRINPIQNEQQKLQLKSLLKNSFGAWTCNHSRMPHLVARLNANAAAKDIRVTQIRNSAIIIFPFNLEVIPKRPNGDVNESFNDSDYNG